MMSSTRAAGSPKIPLCAQPERPEAVAATTAARTRPTPLKEVPIVNLRLTLIARRLADA
jgi:hypothetical protein